MDRVVGRRAGGDSGAVAVTVTVSLTLLFLLAALAIDLGFARADVRNNQTISDLASIAAVDALRRGGDHADACRAAVDYAFANAAELASGSVENAAARSLCTGFLGSGCDPTMSEVVPIQADPYSITVSSPVLDDDPTMTVESQAVNPDVDGEPCDRVKVTVARERAYVFGPVGGNVSGNPAADAVAVYFEEQVPLDIASLIVLEQTDCDALTTSGTGAFFRVNDLVQIGGERFPGLIATDSDGTSSPRGAGTDCSTGNRTVIDQGTGTICAEGSVGSYALGAGDATRSHPAGTGSASCVLPPNGDGMPGLGTQVVRQQHRTGRKSVDWLVNCQAAYAAYNTAGSQRYPFYGDTPACPLTYGPAETPLPPFLDNLRSELQSGSLPGFHVIKNCNGNVSNPQGKTKVHVTCAAGARTSAIVFTDVTHVVFDHSVPQQVVELTVTGGSAGAVVYFRDEGIQRTATSSTTTLTNTFVYVETATGLGVNTNGGSVTWSGVTRGFVGGRPVLHPQCSPLETLPTAACFAPLALWSNSNSDHHYGGNGVQSISGSYFMPNATVTFRGGGTADFTDAQFFGRTLGAVGGGQVTLVPNPETNVQPPRINFGLIR